MKNFDLVNILMRLPADLEVCTFIQNGKLKQITDVYIGNEKYLPNGNKDSVDKIIIQHN